MNSRFQREKLSHPHFLFQTNSALLSLVPTFQHPYFFCCNLAWISKYFQNLFWYVRISFRYLRLAVVIFMTISPKNLLHLKPLWCNNIDACESILPLSHQQLFVITLSAKKMKRNLLSPINFCVRIPTLFQVLFISNVLNTIDENNFYQLVKSHSSKKEKFPRKLKQRDLDEIFDWYPSDASWWI
jgi:hypothetical protein